MKLRLIFMLALAVGALAVPASSGAGVVRFTSCVASGSTTTTAGSLQFSIGWGTSQYGNMAKFLKSQRVEWTFAVNGGTPTTTSTTFGDTTLWTTPVQNTLPDGRVLWQTRFTSPVVATLVSGDTVTASLSVYSNAKVYDDDRAVYGPGEIFTIPCTITVPVQ